MDSKKDTPIYEEFESVKEALKATMLLANAESFGKVSVDDGHTIVERDFNIKDLQEMLKSNLYKVLDLLGFEYGEVE